MINSTIHYELEMATRQQEQLRSKAVLWDLARRPAADGHRLARPYWLRIGLTLVVRVLGPAHALINLSAPRLEKATARPRAQHLVERRTGIGR